MEKGNISRLVDKIYSFIFLSALFYSGFRFGVSKAILGFLRLETASPFLSLKRYHAYLEKISVTKDQRQFLSVSSLLLFFPTLTAFPGVYSTLIPIQLFVLGFTGFAFFFLSLFLCQLTVGEKIGKTKLAMLFGSFFCLFTLGWLVAQWNFVCFIFFWPSIFQRLYRFLIAFLLQKKLNT